MPRQEKGLFIGLMSGTSIDAVDAVLVRFSDQIKVIESHSLSISTPLKNTILSLCSAGENEIERSGQLDRELGLLFAQCATELCVKANISAERVEAIGSHGQTVRHTPEGKYPFTLQISDPNTIAEETGITTIADFRRRDIAAGGQGAPLVPAFHEALFKNTKSNRVIVNIGGMANITLLSKTESIPVIGFDTGPGNVLLDYWIHKKKALAFDDSGQWASSGKIHASLLEQLLSEHYLQLPPPKSTGRELFNADWLNHHLSSFSGISDADIQCTIAELTAQSIANSISHCDSELSTSAVDEVFICGGGAKNNHLKKRIQALLPEKTVTTTAKLGLDPDLVEATAFAWLAYRTINQLNGSLASVTGAKGDRVLGGIYLTG